MLKSIIALGLTLLISPLSVGQNTRTNNKTAYGKALDVIGSSMALLNRYFVDSVDIDKLSRTGLNAMLQSLDPYTEYYSKEDNDKLRLLTTGEYAGIGAVITQRRDSTVLINDPMEGMPAALAGLKAGDVILEVDGKDYRKSTSEVVSAALKGAPGSKITVLIQRMGEKKPRKIEFERRKIVINPVPYYGITPSGYGYISLTSFPNTAASEVRRAFLELKEQHKIRGLILDLKGNGGGLLDEAVKIVSMFVPEGKLVVRTKGRAELKLNESYRTKQKPLDTIMPLVVLIDGQSASSSEIVAGALQDMDRATIMGSKSFGKGLVQSTLNLPHEGILKLTTAKYYIPSGRCIQRVNYEDTRAGRKAEEMPDSLKTIFYTQSGRPVRDAGGIIPDIELKADTLPAMIYYLAANPDVFDWVTSYVQRYPKIASVKEFKLSNSDYADFSKMLQSKKFDYDRQSLKTLEKLQEIAEFEGYLGQSRELIDSLKKKLEPNLEHDLRQLRPHIERYLTSSIVARYYYRRGALEREVLESSTIAEADKLLADTLRYRRLLLPQK